MNYIAIANSCRYALPTFDDETGLVNAVIEAPRGSHFKYKFDSVTNEFILDEVLPQGGIFPFDFGFVPSTRAADGDPLDIMVFLEEPSEPGAVLSTHLIGVIEAEQQIEGGKALRKDLLLAVLETHYNPSRFHALSEVAEYVIAEIEHFFVRYHQNEGRPCQLIGRGGPDKAMQLVRQSMIQPATKAG